MECCALSSGFMGLHILTFLSLSQILPLTPLGLGTRDLSLIALFSSFGISREQTLVFSWVEFIVASIVSLSLVFTMGWIFEKTRIKTVN